MEFGSLSPIADLQVVDVAKLIAVDDAEIDRLFNVCSSTGFFYIDLKSWKDGEIMSQLKEAETIVEDWFKKPISEKERTVTLSDAHGYKRVGQQSGVNEGQRDGYESLRLSRTAQLAKEALPEVVETHQGLFDNLHFGCQQILKTILQSLSSASSQAGNNVNDFEHSHLDHMDSRSALYFLHHPPKPAGAGLGQNIHTDAGTLTLLFTQQPGLQVLSPTTGEWEYVAARAGHGIVNVGDTLRFLSGERFRSALHRVLPLTDAEGAQRYDRYSTAYFLRAANEAVFVGNDGKETTAEEWFLRKFHSFTQDRSTQRVSSVAFGGMEKSLGVTV